MKIIDTLRRRVSQTQAEIDNKREEIQALISDLEAYRRALNVELRKQGLTEEIVETGFRNNGHAPKYVSKSSAIFETIKAHQGLTKRELLRIVKENGVDMRGNYFYDVLTRFVERGQVKLVDKKYYIAD